MCMSCGCGEPTNRHGNPDNITLDDLQRAARAANIDVARVAANIQQSARQPRAGGERGASSQATQAAAGGRKTAAADDSTSDLLGTTRGRPAPSSGTEAAGGGAGEGRLGGSGQEDSPSSGAGNPP